MMHRDHRLDARDLRLRLAACALAAALGCTARSRSPSADSQAHWLKPCVEDAQCGELSCLCGVCSLVCANADDCGPQDGTALTCMAAGAPSSDCADLTEGDGLCAPLCQGGDCAAGDDGESSGSSIARSDGRIPSDAEPVPSCPAVARTSGLPPFFLWTEMGDYDGIATVNQITENAAVVLVPNEIDGQHLELRFNQPLPSFLPLGQRVATTLRRAAGPDAPYALLVLRDEAGELLVVRHTGTDRLYQDGVFASSDAIGATLTLTMLCQSPESDGCFVNQTQADYKGTFGADTTVAFDTPATGQLTIEGAAYQTTFFSSSVDGDGIRPGSGCQGITPNRYLDFTLLRE
jgi:hypothetical protein